jgi:hypothetical protein
VPITPNLEPIVAAAERVLAGTLGHDIRLGDVTRLSDDGRRNLLLRCHDVSKRESGSFVVKKVVADHYNPEDATSWDTTRFFSDWSGAEFLSGTLSVPRTARFFGGDRAMGFFILEDLGDHRSLVEPLLEEDAAGAERALLAFWRCLGSVHAATIGRRATFEQLVRRLHPAVGTGAPALERFSDRANELQTTLNGMGVRVQSGFTGEIAAVVAAIERPGPFLSYTHGDPCPDNVSWTGEALRLIDFEFGGLGHALTDAAYGRMLFPSCWCANRLPEDVTARMESVYRAELVTGCPEAQDDRVFEAALALVCGAWLLNSLSRSLPRAMEGDSTWGIATLRQRVLARLEAFVATAEEFGQLPAIRGMAAQLLDILQKAWPETPSLALYPAFRKA